MEYKEISPIIALTPYIHTFWQLKGDDLDKQWERNFPDACAGLVINLGDTCLTDNGSVSMEFGRTYAVGAMRSFKDSFIEKHTHLFGVCLKPGMFPNFYDYVPQSEIADQTVQLERVYSFDVDTFIKNPVYYLNSFFIDRLQSRNLLLESVIKDIDQTQGQSSIGDIAKKNFTTVRQLERNFKIQIGITPKEYSRIVRFQNALSKIRDSAKETSLLDIAFECGYYDHSHLTNDIKRNTGLVPSQI
ncbi:helix-turn-helix transcriptional regulator [Albibacterium sp.]|uniref:helix-turn-helix transcriptional regulator n=1 Tax=Albibacterium sp. TaxID=2952885 RepID=UPI002B6B58D2|nr:helix-turn-helix transcriptional regulator [Albibacterium sp.]HUH19394.1 helix-turn-helix transcriptional regulator [Albibacterium sp.]